MDEGVFETTITDGVLQARRPHTDWLSTGVDGGRQHADAAYNVTVPTGWKETDLRAYIDRRGAAAGFDTDGPALLTGVAQRHARRAVLDPVEVIVTAGLSNPATLPPRDSIDTSTPTANAVDSDGDAGGYHHGTINIIVGTTRALPPAALASLLAGVAEAKTATLSRRTGFTGTTSDAVIVGSDPDGEPTRFVGSATTVGNAARACVRDGLIAALNARYPNEEHPESVADADHGIETTATATVSTPG
jgi:adenosylcobinamide hydrolase